MPFTTDGRVHRSGTLNEKEVCTFLNTQSTIIKSAILSVLDCNQATFEHRGGTHSKADAEIVTARENKTISIKHHKGSGTFDWFNSSAAIPKHLKSILSTELQKIRATFDASQKSNADEDIARTACENLFAEHLRSMSSDSIKSMLSNCYTNYTDYVIITHCVKNEILMFDRRKNISELRTYDDWTYFLKASHRAKTSAQIWRRSADGQVQNTNLRMRLVLNNGVSALLGLSKNNSSSIPCLKIQQDNVKQFIATLSDPLKESYTVLASVESVT